MAAGQRWKTLQERFEADRSRTRGTAVPAGKRTSAFAPLVGPWLLVLAGWAVVVGLALV